MFIFGVVIPTIVTVVFFVVFLVCWFKFNMRERIIKTRFFKKYFTKADPTSTDDTEQEHGNKRISYQRSGLGRGPDDEWDDQDPRDPTEMTMLSLNKSRIRDNISYSSQFSLDTKSQDTISMEQDSESYTVTDRIKDMTKPYSTTKHTASSQPFRFPKGLSPNFKYLPVDTWQVETDDELIPQDGEYGHFILQSHLPAEEVGEQESLLKLALVGECRDNCTTKHSGWVGRVPKKVTWDETLPCHFGWTASSECPRLKQDPDGRGRGGRYPEDDCRDEVQLADLYSSQACQYPRHPCKSTKLDQFHMTRPMEVQ